MGVFADASNNPFGSSAGASDKPYYIFAVGGRHAPQGAFGGGPGFGVPFALVESLTPPNMGTGKPTSAITTPRGTTTIDGAVYCGLGFVVGT